MEHNKVSNNKKASLILSYNAIAKELMQDRKEKIVLAKQLSARLLTYNATNLAVSILGDRVWLYDIYHD